MFNRFFSKARSAARRKASQSAAWAVFARDAVSGFLTTAHHTLMVLGLCAITAHINPHGCPHQAALQRCAQGQVVFNQQ